MVEFKGVITAIVTPLTGQDKLDVDALEELVHFQTKHEVNGFFVSGTMGEGIILNLDTRKKLLEKTLEFTGTKAFIIFHAGSARIKEAMDLISYAVDLGVDAVAAFPPIYYPYDKEALVDYYIQVSSLHDVPFFIYNIPPRTGINIGIELVKRIIEKSSNVVGIKDSSGDIKNTVKYLSIENFTVLMGSDTLSLPGLMIGCRGVVSALSNIVPELFVQMYKLLQLKKNNEAYQIYKRILKLKEILSKYPYIASYKAALSIRGLQIKNIVNKPLRSLNAEEIESLKREIAKILKDLTR